VKNTSSIGAKAPPFSDAQKPKKKDITIEPPPAKEDSTDKVAVIRKRGRPPKKQKPNRRRKTGKIGKPGKGGKEEKAIEIDLDDNEGEEKNDNDSDSDFSD
jgi:hypothetical protein